MPLNLDLIEPKLSSLLELWEAARGDRTMPAKSDLPPSVLSPWLSNMVLIEACPDRRYRYQFYGSEFVQSFGVKMEKKFVDELPPLQAEIIKSEYDLAVRTGFPQARRFASDFDPSAGSISLRPRRETWERLVLPLADDDGQPSVLLVGAYRVSVEELEQD